MDAGTSFDLSENLNLMKNFELKNQGSEAKVYFGTFLGRPSVLKERFHKKYRHADLDKALTTERIRAEIRALNKCWEIGIKCPAVYFADVQQRIIILQEITNSLTVKDHLKSVQNRNGPEGINALTSLAHKIGENIAKMHKQDLVHGDLTTSNLLIKEEHVDNIVSGQDFDVYLIDFGLSKRDANVEDKAVDMYVLERAISSSHPNSDSFYSAIQEHYIKVLGNSSVAIVKKLDEVKLRGRKRTMVG